MSDLDAVVHACPNCDVCAWGASECNGWTWEWQSDGTRRRVGERHPMCERCGHCRFRHHG